MGVGWRTYRLFRLDSPAKAPLGILDSPARVSTRVFSADWLANIFALNTWSIHHGVIQQRTRGTTMHADDIQTTHTPVHVVPVTECWWSGHTRGSEGTRGRSNQG
jgi:hypothetical protein